MPQPDAADSGTFVIGGDITINRLGYGAMRITGDGIWGPPEDHDGAIAVLERCLEIGVTFIDTADSYGPEVSEDLIREALHPYPDDLLIATKAGLERGGPNQWTPNGHPDHLRAACDGSLQRLDLDVIDLYQLHRIDADVPMPEQIGALIELRDAGKIRHIGLSEVSVDDLAAVQELTPVATVQNRYNLLDREWEPVLEACTRQGIGFIPWFPIATGDLAQPGGVVDDAADELGASPSQIALAWLLRRSPVMLPIPGTSSVAHLDENVGAAAVQLPDHLYNELVDAA